MLKKYIFVVIILLSTVWTGFGQELVLVNPDSGTILLKNALFMRKIVIKKDFVGKNFKIFSQQIIDSAEVYGCNFVNIDYYNESFSNLIARSLEGLDHFRATIYQLDSINYAAVVLAFKRKEIKQIALNRQQDSLTYKRLQNERIEGTFRMQPFVFAAPNSFFDLALIANFNKKFKMNPNWQYKLGLGVLRRYVGLHPTLPLKNLHTDFAQQPEDLIVAEVGFLEWRAVFPVGVAYLFRTPFPKINVRWTMGLETDFKLHNIDTDNVLVADYDPINQSGITFGDEKLRNQVNEYYNATWKMRYGFCLQTGLKIIPDETGASIGMDVRYWLVQDMPPAAIKNRFGLTMALNAPLYRYK